MELHNDDDKNLNIFERKTLVEVVREGRIGSEVGVEVCVNSFCIICAMGVNEQDVWSWEGEDEDA